MRFRSFTGLIYRLDYPKVVCLIFGSGKMVITGARAKAEILEAVQFIQDELAVATVEEFY